jgi:hypothetical protein
MHEEDSERVDEYYKESVRRNFRSQMIESFSPQENLDQANGLIKTATNPSSPTKAISKESNSGNSNKSGESADERQGPSKNPGKSTGSSEMILRQLQAQDSAENPIHQNKVDSTLFHSQTISEHKPESLEQINHQTKYPFGIKPELIELLKKFNEIPIENLKKEIEILE